MSITQHDDTSYFILMRNRQKCAEILKTDESGLVFARGTAVAHNNGRKSKDTNLGRYGLDGFDPVICDTTRYEEHAPFRCIGIEHFGCYNDRDLQYLVVSIPIAAYGDEITRYVVCRRGDLFRVSLHNRRIAIKDVNAVAPVIEDELIKEVLKNTYLFVKNSKKIAKTGVRLRRGVIIDGKPGNGKTMLCNYINALCQKDGITTKTYSSTQLHRAAMEGKLDRLFWSADIIFFDDIDVTFLVREGANATIAANILTAMDGMNNSNNCVVRVFTTNENLDNIDPAFIRPGRVDAKFRIGLPDAKQRATLINSWPKEVRDHINTEQLVDITDGFSFSQVEEIRSKMAINYTIDGTWSLEKALKEFDLFNQQIKPKKFSGFGSSNV